MTLTYAFFIYLLIWWVMLFVILPFGITRNDEDGKGYDHGAPKFPNLGKKLVINTIVSGLILAVICLLIEAGVIRWSEWFDGGYQ